MDAMDHLIETKEEPVKNLFGALIFWLYIVLALVFTGLVLHSIIRLPAARPSNRKFIRLFSFLALFSFSALSFNMLHVLIHSFALWRNIQRQPLLLSIMTFHSTAWQWSITSTLFKDFGIAIVGNLARYFWTQASLWATMSMCIYMSVEGTRRRIPRLWAYFALSQILPISFAQNLFYLAQLKAPVTSRRIVIRMPMALSAGIVLLYGSCLVLAVFPVVWEVLQRILVIGCTDGTEDTPGSCISARDLAVDSKYLLSTIIAARLLLVLPFFLPRQDVNEKQPQGNSDMTRIQTLVGGCAATMTVAVVWLLYDMDLATFMFVGLRHEIWPALWSHPAVTSLGFDFLVSAVSAWLWFFMQRGRGLDEEDPVEESTKSK